jgi:hypothetical protein
MWNGGKFDWAEGNWLLQANVMYKDWWKKDANGVFEPGYPLYWPEGGSAVAAFAGGDANAPADIAYDNIEVRWGYWTSESHTLDLRKIKTEDYGSVTIDPDLLDGVINIDPNDFLAGTRPLYNELRRYTEGTEIVLVADPCDGRSWKKWKIWEDPNDYPNATSVISDTNTVLYLTMDKDYVVEAIFSCSESSSLLPPVAIVLLLLSLGVVIRRMM